MGALARGPLAKGARRRLLPPQAPAVELARRDDATLCRFTRVGHQRLVQLGRDLCRAWARRGATGLRTLGAFFQPRRSGPEDRRGASDVDGVFVTHVRHPRIAWPAPGRPASLRSGVPRHPRCLLRTFQRIRHIEGPRRYGFRRDRCGGQSQQPTGAIGCLAQSLPMDRMARMCVTDVDNLAQIRNRSLCRTALQAGKIECEQRIQWQSIVLPGQRGLNPRRGARRGSVPAVHISGVGIEQSLRIALAASRPELVTKLWNGRLQQIAGASANAFRALHSVPSSAMRTNIATPSAWLRPANQSSAWRARAGQSSEIASRKKMDPSLTASSVQSTVPR